MWTGKVSWNSIRKLILPPPPGGGLHVFIFKAFEGGGGDFREGAYLFSKDDGVSSP